MQAEQIKNLMDGRLFKILLRVTKVSEGEARRLATELVKYFQDADVSYELWSHGQDVWTANMEFTTQFAMKPGEGEKVSEDIARICANVIWRAIGEYREPIKIKVAPFADFTGTTTTYVLDDGVYWCDFWDEEFAETMAAAPVAEGSKKLVTR